MKRQRLAFTAPATALVFALWGCASTQGDIAQRAAEVKIYRMNDLSGTPYQVVSRLWVGSWRSAFWAPTYPSEDEAIASLRAEAARLGANALVSVICLDQRRAKPSQSGEPAILCYANAVNVSLSRNGG